MNKVVCAICGTSYSEKEESCPVCGYAQSVEVQQDEPAAASAYVPVKGGRFSSSNVKKRNNTKPVFVKKPEAGKKTGKNKSSKQTNVGAIVVIALLLLAIIAVSGYIALRFFIPNDYLYEGLDGLTIFGKGQQAEQEFNDPEQDAVAEQEAEPSLNCTALVIRNEIFLNAVGAEYQLKVTPIPADTVDEVLYTISDAAVATVSESGLVTAVGEGEAVITITCGNTFVEAYVTVTEEVAETELIKFMLNRKEINFLVEGESWVLYDGMINGDEIVWTSDDTSVATIENGVVVAVGNGETVVYGFYGGQTASCEINCTFEDVEEGSNGNVSEATGTEAQDDNKTYSLYNPQGQAKDVTIGVGKTFVLLLVDEEKNVVTDATWIVEDTNVCTYSTDGTVTGVHGGVTNVSATYKGQTYTCIVRVG